jgi:hypothetical protein
VSKQLRSLDQLIIQKPCSADWQLGMARRYEQTEAVKLLESRGAPQ